MIGLGGCSVAEPGPQRRGTPSGSTSAEPRGEGVATHDCHQDPDIGPDQLEHIGDAVDSDCDGAPDTAWLREGIVVGPAHSPQFLDLDGDLLLAGWADSVSVPGHYAMGQARIGLSLGPEPTGLADPLGVRFGLTRYDVGYDGVVQEVAQTPTGLVIATREYEGYPEGPGATQVRAYALEAAEPGGAFSVVSVGASRFPGLVGLDGAVDVALDPAGEPWVVGCGPFTLQVLIGAASGAPFRALPDPELSGPIGGGPCFWADTPDGQLGTLVTCDPFAGCSAIEVELADPPTLTPVSHPTWDGRLVRAVGSRGGSLAVVDDQTGVEVHWSDGADRVLAGHTVLAVDAVERGDRRAVAAVVDDGGERALLVGWSEAGAPWTVVPWRTDVPPGAEASVGIHVSDTQLAVSVADDRSMGWATLAW